MQSESHPDTHVNTQTHTREYILTYMQRCIQTHAQRHTHTHTHTGCPTSILLPSVFPATAPTLPAPLLRGRAGPSRKTGWQDSLPRLLSVLCGPPSQIPVSQHESRHEGPFIFGKRRCGRVSGSWGREPWPQPGGLVRIAWNKGSRSDLGTQEVLRNG